MTARRRLLLLILAGAGPFAFTAPAGAAEGASFSITPSGGSGYFVLDAPPGQQLSRAVKVTNVADSPGAVRLYGVDATTGQTGGAVYLSEAPVQHDVGTWIHLAPDTVALGPHESRTVSFRIDVPVGAGAGQHLGGLVAAPVTPTSTRSGRTGRNVFRVNIHEISIVAVQVDVPGAVRSALRLTGVGSTGRVGYQALTVGLANTGNVLLKGSGRLRLVGGDGQAVLQRSFNVDTLLPGTAIDLPIYVSGQRLAAGTYTASVTVRLDRGRPVRGTFTVTISPHQVAQTYGSRGLGGTAQGAAGGGGSPPAWLLGLGAVILLGAGFGVSLALQRMRASGREGSTAR